MHSDVFLAAVNKLIADNLEVGDLLNTAERLKAEGKAEAVIKLYELWIGRNQNHPQLCAIHFNHGVALSDAGDLAGARDALNRAVAIDPDFIPAYINLGSTHEKLGAVDQAVIHWSTALGKLSTLTGTALHYKTTALNQLGRVLETSNLDAQAENALRQSLELDSSQHEVVQHFIALRQRQCEWPVIAPWESVDRKTLMKGISPLSLGAYADDPVLQLANAYTYNLRVVGLPSVSFAPRSCPASQAATSRPLRVGYLSSDLRHHAVGFLSAEIFELHDRRQVEVFAYYCGVPGEDPMKARIRDAVDHWLDIADLDDETAARRMTADGIDILVDLNGYTKDARTKLVAMRPAPIIVNWLGYPGTLASPYHHYIIADDWVIPPESELYYSEKVMRLPCYQPNDRRRSVAANRPSRREAGLPETGMVYCCFNGLHKITRSTFERWLTILARVPDSVLWLLADAEGAKERLQAAAQQRGIAPERLIFAQKLANDEHLARYPLADLFLDTAPYGAHTTASDALWMGVPILTLSGRSFASRVCGSLVRAAGLPELDCATPEAYVEFAVALGHDRAALRRLRARLEEGRASCTLFDTDLLARRLEDLYGEMHRDYREGRLPCPDLSNLDVYHELAIEDDYDAREFFGEEPPHAQYQAKLARRHRFRPIREDNRLWPPGAIAAALD